MIGSESLIGQTRSSTTNQSGVFRFPSLPIGSYSVQARLNGFTSAEINKIEVSMGQTANVTIRMIMAKAETITVAGETPMIDPQNAGTPTIYKEEMVESLSMRRNMWVLMQVAPGVTVDHGDSLTPELIAYGSNRISSSWNIDGIDITGPETGKAWWSTNPDTIDEIQVYGVGAPAEYGNHLGAVINVVTKKGGNNFHGLFNSFFQSQALTGVNVRLPDSDFVYHRNKYYDVAGQIGGPILSDRIWFFGAAETSRDSYSPPGFDPIFAPLLKSDKYDVKVTSRLGDHYELNGFFHDEVYDNPDTRSPYNTQSATGHIFGNNPAVGATLTSLFSEKFLLELGYAGWVGYEKYGSQTDSFDDPILDVNSNTYSGGLAWPYDYTTYRHQLNAKATYYADHFLKSQHEFKFGAQYFNGSADTITAYGPNGNYLVDYYGGLYNYYQAPFHYGATSQNLGLFLDDSVLVNKRLTLNLGMRFDWATGSLPDYDRLEIGTPSITEVGNFRSTGKKVPGIHNYVDWKIFSPRLGFVWLTREDGRAALRGSFGVYYDHDTTGNWDYPAPDMPPLNVHIFNNQTGQFDYLWTYAPPEVAHDQKLKPPRALQYALGYEFQPTESSSIGVQYVHKDTKNLIGRQITGGTWATWEFIDLFTEKAYTFIGTTPEQPANPGAMVQKGNDPGDFPGSEGLRYFQTYDAAIVTFSKRFSSFWGLNASYTWSRSYGLLPRMISQLQFQPFYSSIREGVSPNQFINATGLLQGDRPHMFRVQAVFPKLPWDLQAASSIEFSSGRPYNRQALFFTHTDLGQGRYRVNMEPPGSRRHSPIQNIDLSVGRVFSFPPLQLVLKGEILNLLNSSQELSFVDLALSDPGSTFIPDAWVQPRRLQIQAGIRF